MANYKGEWDCPINCCFSVRYVIGCRVKNKEASHLKRIYTLSLGLEKFVKGLHQ